MFGWKLRKKPPIVGLAISLSILIMLLALTLLIFSTEDHIGIALGVILDLIVFGFAYFAMSIDVQWIELLTMPKFQRNISMIVLAVAIIIACLMAVKSFEVIEYGTLFVICIATLSCALFFILGSVESAQKTINHVAA